MNIENVEKNQTRDKQTLKEGRAGAGKKGRFILL